MKTITRIPTAPTQYTPDNPQDGCWWHALDAGGKSLFEKQSPRFGKPTKETLTSNKLKGKRCIRCRSSRSEVEAWLPKDGGGAFLKVNKAQIKADEWEVAGQQNDIHVLGSAAISAGTQEMQVTTKKATKKSTLQNHGWDPAALKVGVIYWANKRQHRLVVDLTDTHVSYKSRGGGLTSKFGYLIKQKREAFANIITGIYEDNTGS